ncbi:MAG: hypothetical protein IJW58_01595 [Clostridia bacterium]|nr:hypothetical protein [Clostridia bacterium]
MISKWKMEMLTFLTSLTLVSVGFSSWQISSSPIPDLSATVGVDSVVHTDNFVGLGDPTLFEYNAEDGCFISYDQDGIPVDSGTVANFTLNYTLYPETCNSEDSPFIETSYVENDGSLFKQYYTYAVITCKISTITTNGATATFFNNVNSVNLTNVTFDTATITSLCSLSTDGTLTIRFETERFQDPDLEAIPITCNFSFTIKESSMKAVCQELATSKFTFHTQLSGSYQI